MASRLYQYLLDCWKNGTVDEVQLNTAVSKNYITVQEKSVILTTPKV